MVILPYSSSGGDLDADSLDQMFKPLALVVSFVEAILIRIYKAID
jgi:hypothetical protein